ncbi:MAG: alkaline phosphatase family protein, partial [Phycisphaerae bacterium]
YNQVILDLYKRIDGIVGDVREQYGDEATIFVMSDHGFCCFRRQFNLNTWLRDNGYLQPSDCRSLLDPRRGRLVDWSRTRAYAIGLNGLYVNLAGRERDGIVTPDERATLLDEISEQLLSVRDPLDNSPVIARVDKSDDAYHGPMARAAPDLIVGYHRGYRASWATTLGDITDEILSDNDSAWSADHCMATHLLPGVLFSNKPILQHEPSLVDLAPTILQEFDVTIPSTMEGEDLFAPRSA